MHEQTWFHPRGSLARDGWDVIVDDSIDGWSHTGLRVTRLGDGDEVNLDEGDEQIIVPLDGSFTVLIDGATIDLAGRSSVFAGPSDVLYVSSADRAIVRGSGRVAVASSPTSDVVGTHYLAAADVPVELRGAGITSRQVHNFGTPGVLDAARLIVCEVITPSGNWSSYPPHKHDEHVPGQESQLEEIYYFEAAPEPGNALASPDAAFGQFCASSSPAGQIDINVAVRTGDIALVPCGYHGPAIAAPGYGLYYLNVMAGPNAQRLWLVSDDPQQAWVRDSWQTQLVDPRLPINATESEPT